MMPILLVLFASAAVCVFVLLSVLVRARDRRRLLDAAGPARSDATDGIGISVLCSGVGDLGQIENLLSSEYARYEVVVVLDARTRAAEFEALVARYRIIRVEWVHAAELEAAGVRALGRSRKRHFRRLVLIDRAWDGAAGDYDAAASAATYDWLLPVADGQMLLPGAVERLVAELGSRPAGSLDLVRTWLGEPAVLLARDAVIAAGGFAMHPLRAIPRPRRRTLWEPLLTTPERPPRLAAGVRTALALLLAAAVAAAAVEGWWALAAGLVTAALVWAAAAYASRVIAEMSPAAIRRFVPWRRSLRHY